jgi:hypothetical protein
MHDVEVIGTETRCDWAFEHAAHDEINALRFAPFQDGLVLGCDEYLAALTDELAQPRCGINVKVRYDQRWFDTALL